MRRLCLALVATAYLVAGHGTRAAPVPLQVRGGFDVAGAQADFVREVMEVPADRIGLVIGRQGATIKEIGRQSGVNIWVDPKTNLPGWARILKSALCCDFGNAGSAGTTLFPRMVCQQAANCQKARRSTWSSVLSGNACEGARHDAHATAHATAWQNDV